MALGVDAGARLALVSGYRKEIEHYVSASEGLRALALFFDFVAEFAPNYEDRVLDLSERTQHIFAAATPTAEALATFKYETMALLDRVVAFVAPDATTAPPTQETGDLFAIKKQLLESGGRETLVAVENVTRKLGSGRSLFTLGPLSLDVARGEVIGLVGHNGSGKTTLLRLLAGELAPTKGQIIYPGLSDPEAPQAGKKKRRTRIDWPRVRARIAFVTPHPPVIREPVLTALIWTGVAYGASPAAATEAANVAMHRFGLAAHASKRASALSTGLRLRFEIARIMLTNPDLLVLDEPLANLDVVAQQNLLSDLQVLAASMQRPRGIIISSQHIGEIEAISDRMVVLSNGRPLFVGRKDEIVTKLEVSVFEIVAESKRALIASAKRRNPLEVIEMGVSVVFVFPQTVSRDHLLAHLASENVSITGFQDLSKSAKALLFLDKLLAEGRVGTGVRP